MSGHCLYGFVFNVSALPLIVSELRCWLLNCIIFDASQEIHMQSYQLNCWHSNNGFTDKDAAKVGVDVVAARLHRF